MEAHSPTNPEYRNEVKELEMWNAVYLLLYFWTLLRNAGKRTKFVIYDSKIILFMSNKKKRKENKKK